MRQKVKSFFTKTEVSLFRVLCNHLQLFLQAASHIRAWPDSIIRKAVPKALIFVYYEIDVQIELKDTLLSIFDQTYFALAENSYRLTKSEFTKGGASW